MRGPEDTIIFGWIWTPTLPYNKIIQKLLFPKIWCESLNRWCCNWVTWWKYISKKSHSQYQHLCKVSWKLSEYFLDYRRWISWESTKNKIFRMISIFHGTRGKYKGKTDKSWKIMHFCFKGYYKKRYTCLGSKSPFVLSVVTGIKVATTFFLNGSCKTFS